MAEAYDGHPIQAGSRAGRLTGVYADTSQVGLVEGLVIALRYVDHVGGNRMRNAVEYDVRDIKSGFVFSNVRALQTVAGLTNGDERIYHAASKTLSGKPFSKYSPAQDTDGDYVLVGFISGARANAVILGALPHVRATYNAHSVDGQQGERRFLTQNGTTAMIAQDGAFTIARADTVITVAVDGSVAVVAKDVELGDPESLRPCSGVNDTIHVLLQVLVTALTPFFIPTGLPPPPPAAFVPGYITTGSAAVKVSM